MYQVDAFTSEVFRGNPAAVCLLDEWLPDEQMQAIAAENNLSETAFLVREEVGYGLRWFTPLVEVALCGHATLASAFVLFEFLHWPETSIRFATRWSGVLTVTRREDLLEMDFPARTPAPVKTPQGLDRALGVEPQEVLASQEDILVVVQSEETVRDLTPDFAALSRVECRGVIVTAPGGQCDFVSRFFAPRVGVPEDPVTGSSHCALAPYWSKRLGKQAFHALQVSKRGGEIFCRDQGGRVGIAGRAVLYLEGALFIP